ncbi:hypothetical protein AC249_AIPGENE16623, partial [Exaiptasia diaphana]
GNNIALSLVCVYLKIRKNEARIKPVDVLNLYTELFKAYHQVISLASGNEDYIKYFFGGVQDMFSLPLPLKRTVILITTIICDILKQGNFKDIEVAFILLHLFHSKNPKSLLGEVDPIGLSLHFREVVSLSIAKDLSMMPVISKTSLVDGDARDTSLFKLLVELTPSAFAQRESSDLFKFVIDRLKKSHKSLESSDFLLPLAKVSINRNVTAREFKSEFKELKTVVRSIPRPEIIPIVSKCITEYSYLNDKAGIKTLVPLLLERNWNQGPQFMPEIMFSYLNVPQQIVLAFHEANDTEEKKNVIQRVLDILHQVHPTVLCGKFLEIDGHESAKNEVLQPLAMRDFQMLT